MKHYSMLCIPAIAALALTGCVDNDYDLSDIDKTIRVDVKDLVVPITIDEINLKSVIDIKDDDESIKIIDNAYCYVADGEFTSSSVSIPAVEVQAPTINSINLNAGINNDYFDASNIVIPSVPTDITLKVKASTKSNFELNAANISSDIVSVQRIGGNFDIAVSFNFNSDLKNAALAITLKGVKLQLAKGLIPAANQSGSYDSATGIYSLDGVKVQDNSSINLQFVGLEIGNRYNSASHSFQFKEEIGILNEGELVLKAEDLVVGANLPTEISVAIGFNTSNFSATTFTGEVKYSLTDLNVPEVDLEDLPDVLSQPGTNLVLQNPCIYVQANNPLQEYGIYATTGLSITALRENSSPRIFTPSEPIVFGRPINNTGIYNICLSPSQPTSYEAEFANATSYIKFEDLSNVLAGDGLPSTIQINLTNPGVPTQAVTDFKLGKDYEGINGKYKMMAPLALGAGSTIIYRDVVDDFGGEDLDDLTITKLEVNLVISTNVPVGVKFQGYPLDRFGNRINGVTIEGAQIDANANNQPVSIRITGEVTGVDGIEFEATATSNGTHGALSPSMSISLTNIRPMVSGYYLTEL